MHLWRMKECKCIALKRTLDLLHYPAFFLHSTLSPVALALCRATPADLLQWRLGGSVATGPVQRLLAACFFHLLRGLETPKASSSTGPHQTDDIMGL